MDLHYAVAWQVGADAYDEKVAEAALGKCDQVPGTKRGVEPTSLPPVPQWVFTGSEQQRAEFEDCLLNLDQAVIYGPRKDGEDRSPVLKR